MKILKALINSNIYIAVAAVALTVQTQVQLGMYPQWHPYLFIIFFATLFEYNLHRLVTVITNKNALNSIKHEWVKENIKAFYILVFLSVCGFAWVIFLAKKQVLVAFAPFALITVLYSVPIARRRTSLLRVREIPYLKIFLIALVWAVTTVMLPVIQSGQPLITQHIALLLTERFLFVFAITIPFDIRDIEADRLAGLKTIAVKFNEEEALKLSYGSLVVFALLVSWHYADRAQYCILAALITCAGFTFAFLANKKIRHIPYYHYGILDGTMLLQGLLVIAAYYLCPVV